MDKPTNNLQEKIYLILKREDEKNPDTQAAKSIGNVVVWGISCVLGMLLLVTPSTARTILPALSIEATYAITISVGILFGIIIRITWNKIRQVFEDLRYKEINSDAKMLSKFIEEPDKCSASIIQSNSRDGYSDKITFKYTTNNLLVLGQEISEIETRILSSETVKIVEDELHTALRFNNS